MNRTSQSTAQRPYRQDRVGAHTSKLEFTVVAMYVRAGDNRVVELFVSILS